MRIKEHRPGSITQWIFSENFCKCENPLPTDNVVPITPSIPDATADDAHDDEVSCEVDPNDLPLDRFRPLKVLGRGASGEVYLCRDLLLKKKVAVKCLTHLTPESVISFQSEAKTASKLQHHGVISIKDFGIAPGGKPFMVMEYFPGKNLADLLVECGRLNEPETLQIAIAVCKALIYLHQDDVFHRDLKPSNILVHVDSNNQMQVRLIDFGLSRTMLDVQSQTLSNGKTIAGTPGYMSPDQIDGKTYDARSEIYSFGCTFFEVLTGEQPYEGETALQVLNSHVHQEIPLLVEFVPTVSVKFSEIIETCMNKEKEDRFQSCSQLLDALESVKLATDESQVATLALEEPVSAAPPASAKSRNSLLVVSVLALVAISGLAYAGYLMLGDSAPVKEQKRYTNAKLDERYGYELRKTQPSTHNEELENLVLEKKIADVNEDQAEKKEKEDRGERLAEEEDRTRETKLTPEEDRNDAGFDLSDKFSDTGVQDFVYPGSATPTLNKLIEQQKRVPDAQKTLTEVHLMNKTLAPSDVDIIAKLHPWALNLENAKGVDDAMLKRFSKIPTLKFISVNFIKNFTPEGFSCLTSLPNLQTLTLEGCDITDAHLKVISKVKSLRTVGLSNNKRVTINGIKALGKVRARQVIVNQPSLVLMSSAKEQDLRNNYNIVLAKATPDAVRKQEMLGEWGLDSQTGSRDYLGVDLKQEKSK